MSKSSSAQALPKKVSPGRPPKAEVETRHLHLLRVAATEFIAEGFGNANVARIARSAGVSPKTIYARYPNKDALLIAVVTEMTESSHGLLLAEMTATDGDPEHVLLAFGLRVAKVWTSPLEVGLYRLILAEAPRFPSLAAIYMRVMVRFRDTLVHYLRRQVDHGVFVIDDCEAAARQFGMLVYSEVRERALLGEQQLFEDVSTIVRQGVRVFVAGYSNGR